MEFSIELLIVKINGLYSIFLIVIQSDNKRDEKSQNNQIKCLVSFADLEMTMAISNLNEEITIKTEVKAVNLAKIPKSSGV